ncbi:MAG: hypothetical protein JXA72_12290 [Bacteroidales bacterium]|nr:hypothetical protein [Bacteroidales bacterium]
MIINLRISEKHEVLRFGSGSRKNAGQVVPIAVKLRMHIGDILSFVLTYFNIFAIRLNEAISPASGIAVKLMLIYR